MESQEIKQTTSEIDELKILGIEKFDRAEWVFQFDEEEPIVIAWSSSKEEPGELSFVLKANSESNLIFRSSDGLKKLQIFSRRMNDERREELDNLQKIEEELINEINSGEENKSHDE